MKKINICMLTLVAFSVLCFEAQAGMFSKKTPDTPKKPAAIQEQKSTNYLDVLNLTQEQKDFYHQIRKSEYEQISPIIEKIRLKHQELEKLMRTDMPAAAYDFQELKIKEELVKYHQEIKVIKLKTEEKIEAVLTDEQKKQYQKLKEESFRVTERKTPSRSMGSVSTSKEFIYKPCEGTDGAPACKIDDLLKKESKQKQ